MPLLPRSVARGKTRQPVHLNDTGYRGFLLRPYRCLMLRLVIPNLCWLKEAGVKTLHIRSGSPWQNGFVESFHGRFRDECLNREVLWKLTEAQVVIGDYRREYNEFRPHSRLGYLSPSSYARNHLPSPVPVGLRPPSTGDGQTTTERQTSTSAMRLSPPMEQFRRSGHWHLDSGQADWLGWHRRQSCSSTGGLSTSRFFPGT